jgi:hypothetical protein
MVYPGSVFRRCRRFARPGWKIIDLADWRGTELTACELGPKEPIRKAAEIGWKPLHFLNIVSTSIGAVIKPAGFENAQGIVSVTVPTQHRYRAVRFPQAGGQAHTRNLEFLISRSF